MDTEFNSQESEFQETDNQLGNEEGQADGNGSWDEEISTDVDQLEDKEEAEGQSSEDIESSEVDLEDEDDGDQSDTQEDTDEDESNLQKNTPDERSNRVLSFEDYFKN
jgi:hypothetical protein